MAWGHAYCLLFAELARQFYYERHLESRFYVDRVLSWISVSLMRIFIIFLYYLFYYLIDSKLL